MKYTLTQCKQIQAEFEKILETSDMTGDDNYTLGLCYYLSGKIEGVHSYCMIGTLMDMEKFYISEKEGITDERVMFLILYTTVSPQELRNILNSR